MELLNLSPEALEELVLDHSRPRYYLDGTVIPYPRKEVPVFVNDQGPFLVRQAPNRLVLIPMRTAYALVCAFASPRITWPPYSPKQEWVVRASSNAFYGY